MCCCKHAVRAPLIHAPLSTHKAPCSSPLDPQLPVVRRWALEQTNPNLGPWVSALDEQFDEEAIAQEADQVAARAAALEAEMARDAAAARSAPAQHLSCTWLLHIASGAAVGTGMMHFPGHEAASSLSKSNSDHSGPSAAAEAICYRADSDMQPL